MNLGKHLIRRIHFPDQLVSNRFLEMPRPLTQKEDTGLDELKLAVTGDIFIRYFLPSLTSSLSFYRKDSYY